MNKRPYQQWFDGSGDEPVPSQTDDPVNLRFVPSAAANPRTLLGSDANPYIVADQAVRPLGSKNILWSSEGYASLGNNLTAFPLTPTDPVNAAMNAVAIPALSAAQKKATGSAATNIGTLLGSTAPALDFSGYHSLDAVITLSTFTGGTSIAFEIDMQDDAATPNVLAAWNSGALTATQAMIIVHIGLDQPFVQTTAASSSEPATGFTAQANLPAGVLFYPVYLPLFPQGGFKWTIVGTFSAIAWTAFLYGKY